ncbi:RusA family crossover junction endodeoxyribonuclease [Pseudomonas chlororaphis]|uniref:RusA family crossover junction endodeoxyribonuclease n=1 Tax=Pseudomonas chlororaphis TaxID=587753 RepID=UPI00215A2B23|nr:RusA family crossover junction endodeoxyribonuclease [Pseudomonas chlororaphis]UVE47592.1 RusA family crossover junction endodeoxyribonuclease [Pseudomonas chlororaphis]
MSDHKPVTFLVPGEAVGKGRPRVRMLPAKAGKKPVPMLYTPPETKNYEEVIAVQARASMLNREPIQGPVLVELKILVSVAASWSKKKTAAALAGQVMPTKKPDADNVLKAICDGINGIVFKDDVQVVNVSMSKRFAETPGVYVRVVPLLGESS